MVNTVVPDPEILPPSLKAPTPTSYHRYEIYPLFSAGFSGDCTGKVAVD